MVPAAPSHLETKFIRSATYIESGQFIHFTCKRTSSSKYREYKEVPTAEGKARDDALDNKFGVQCDNGRFKQPTEWPKENECEVKNTCNGAQ